ncbi:MAG: S41 family peptidase [Bacteroidota bacterium]
MKYILVFLIIVCSNTIFGQTREAKMIQVLDTVISKSKDISYYTKSVDWDSLTTKIYEAAKGAEEIDDLKPAFETLLNGLRDHHGHIRKTSDYSIVANFTDHMNSRNADNREYDPEIWKIVNNVDSRYEYALLPNQIGYLKIVGVGPNLDGHKEAERIRNSLIELHNNKVNKWIIDLRYNGGGNINVMLAGIAPLLDTETVVNIQDENKNTLFTGDIIKNDFWYAGNNVFPIGKKPRIRKSKIAVLTSRWTTSSGEFVAVAFKGQKNTRFFGEPTEGKTTNNSWEIINNEIVLVISTGVYCDRNGNAYVENVKPDKEIPFEVEENREKDKGIVEAMNWLNN